MVVLTKINVLSFSPKLILSLGSKEIDSRSSMCMYVIVHTYSYPSLSEKVFENRHQSVFLTPQVMTTYNID